MKLNMELLDGSNEKMLAIGEYQLLATAGLFCTGRATGIGGAQMAFTYPDVEVDGRDVDGVE